MNLLERFTGGFKKKSIELYVLNIICENQKWLKIIKCDNPNMVIHEVLSVIKNDFDSNSYSIRVIADTRFWFNKICKVEMGLVYYSNKINFELIR
jgi:hypothetical protein